VPVLREARFAEAWAGLRPTLPDHVPAIGPVPELDALWVAAGHHRNGILLAGWTGEHLAKAMLEGAALPGVVAPGRFKAAVTR
jgi:glycine/D-amino acid oxidase-like deaminating enzyme